MHVPARTRTHAWALLGESNLTNPEPFDIPEDESEEKKWNKNIDLKWNSSIFDEKLQTWKEIHKKGEKNEGKKVILKKQKK